MKTNTLKLAILFLGAMILPMPTAFMGVDLVSNALASNTATQAVTVNATVPTNCNFTNGSGVTLAFGNYDPVGTQATADLHGSTSFNFRCTKGGSATLGIDLGSNAASSQRRMKQGTEYLNYELYSDASFSTVWGNASGSWVSYTATTAIPQPFTIYGSVPQAQDVSVGAYTDTVTVTATF